MHCIYIYLAKMMKRKCTPHCTGLDRPREVKPVGRSTNSNYWIWIEFMRINGWELLKAKQNNFALYVITYKQTRNYFVSLLIILFFVSLYKKNQECLFFSSIQLCSRISQLMNETSDAFGLSVVCIASFCLFPNNKQSN